MTMKIVSYRCNLIFQTVKFIIFFLKAVGLAPFSVRTKTSVKYFRKTYNWVIECSNVGLGYNILITILLPTTAAYFFQDILSANYTNKSSLTLATDTAQVICVISTSFVILISWTLNRKKATDIINRLLNVYFQLSSTKIPPSCNKSLILLSVHVLLNATLCILMLVRIGLTLDINSFTPIIFTPLPSLVICWYITEYSMIVLLVNAQLESVNKNLLHSTQIRNSFLIDPFHDSHIESSSLSIYSQPVVLHCLQSYRTMLFEISQDIANFFSIPVLFCFAYSFSTLVFNAYYLVITVVAPNGVFELLSFFGIVNWIIIIVYPITALLLSITKTVNEAKLTGRIVHKLLALSTNEEIKTKLIQFSLQLLHENPNYTACGFFTLDFTLLHAMLGSMVTYLVILIQFQLSEN